MTVEVWNACAAPVDRAALRGRTCYGGLDLSGKHDLSALVLVFPDDAAEPVYDVLPILWTPDGQLAARQARERDNFDLWIRQGHLIAVPETIRTAWIAAEIGRLAAESASAASPLTAGAPIHSSRTWPTRIAWCRWSRAGRASRMPVPTSRC